MINQRSEHKFATLHKEKPPGFGAEDDVYADFETGGQGIALFARTLMAEAVGMAEAAVEAQDAAVLATGDVDEAADALRAKGVALVAEPTDRPLWGIRTAHLRDRDGHLIEINSPLPGLQAAA